MELRRRRQVDIYIFGFLTASLLVLSVLSRSISTAFLLSKITAISTIAFYILRNLTIPIRLHQIFYFYVTFMIWALLTSVTMNAQMIDVINQLSTMLQILIVGLVLYNVFQYEKDYRILSLIFLGASFFLVFGQYLGIEVKNYGYRFQGLTSNANIFGMYLTYSAISLLYLLSTVSKKMIVQMGLILAFLLVAYYIFLSGSRKSLAALLAVIFTYFLLNGLLKRNLFRIVIMVMVPLFLFRDKVLTVIYSSPLYFRITNEAYLELGTQIRLDNISEAWSVFLENPVFGVGLDNFKYHNYSGLVAHNYFLEVMAGTGIIGLIILALLYLKIGRLAYTIYLRKEGRDEGIFAFMFLAMSFVFALGFHLHNTIEHWLFISMLLPLLANRQQGRRAIHERV